MQFPPQIGAKNVSQGSFTVSGVSVSADPKPKPKKKEMFHNKELNSIAKEITSAKGSIAAKQFAGALAQSMSLGPFV